VHVEVHCAPEKAMSDGAQALRPPQFDALMQSLKAIAAVVGKTFN